MNALTAPIFCDHCSCLALAVIGADILCTSCLLDRVRGGVPTDDIRPLPLVGVGPDRQASPNATNQDEPLEA